MLWERWERGGWHKSFGSKAELVQAEPLGAVSKALRSL